MRSSVSSFGNQLLKEQLGGFTSYEPYEPKRDMNAVVRHETNIEISSAPRQDFDLRKTLGIGDA